MTVRLMGCIVFIFSFIIFKSFPDDFVNEECNYLLTCYVATLNFGPRATAGIGERLQTYYVQEDLQRWVVRGFIFDMLYFIFVNIILINVIFGIIIDTFGALRVQKIS